MGIRLLDAPTDRADDPRAKLYIVDHVPPGTTIQRRIQVDNATDEDQLIKLYPGAARLEEGKFIALGKARRQRPRRRGRRSTHRR